MTKPHADAEIIKALGGPAEVARKLDLDPAKGGVQRVQNWTVRGIPAAIRLRYLGIFGKTAKPAPRKPSPERRAS